MNWLAAGFIRLMSYSLVSLLIAADGPADKAVLRLAIGLGLAVLIAYGLALPAPFVGCVMTVLMVCKPGPPIPFIKGVVIALVIGGLLAAGVLMVPILENYAVTGVLLTGVLLYAVSSPARAAPAR